MILTDTFIVENAELLIEHRGGKTIRRLRGIFGRCDEKNNNGRVYSKTLLEREVTRISEAMLERRLLGELDHPTHDAVKLSNVSHLITGLDFNGKELVGECELLDTPSGKVAQALVEGGVKIGISSRGMGTLSEHADGTKHVNEDFKLVTFDLVADPSTRGAFPGISESALVEEIVKDTLDKAAKEKIFTTMLKDKLREKLDIGTQSGKWTKETVKEIQKKSVKKNPEKPTVQEPFKNWEYFYGWNLGKPRVVKTRSYPDADSVTAPAEVTENRYFLLKDVLVEADNEVSVSVLLQLLREAVKAVDFATKRQPGALKKLIGKVAQKTGDALSGKAETPGGLAGKMEKPGAASWKKGGMRDYVKARRKEKFLAKNPKPDAAPEVKTTSSKATVVGAYKKIQAKKAATSDEGGSQERRPNTRANRQKAKEEWTASQSAKGRKKEGVARKIIRSRKAKASAEEEAAGLPGGK